MDRPRPCRASRARQGRHDGIGRCLQSRRSPVAPDPTAPERGGPGWRSHRLDRPSALHDQQHGPELLDRRGRRAGRPLRPGCQPLDGHRPASPVPRSVIAHGRVDGPRHRRRRHLPRARRDRGLRPSYRALAVQSAGAAGPPSCAVRCHGRCARTAAGLVTLGSCTHLPQRCERSCGHRCPVRVP